MRERLARGDVEGAISYARHAVIESYRQGLHMGVGDPLPRKRPAFWKFWARRR